MACFLLVSLTQPLATNCSPDEFPDPEPDPRQAHKKDFPKGIVVPSHFDVDIEYWRNDQPLHGPDQVLDDDPILEQVDNELKEQDVEDHQQSFPVPSDADVGFAYWRTDQPQPKPGEPVYSLDDDHVLGQVRGREDEDLKEQDVENVDEKNCEESVTLPSDADVGYDYWTSGQPQPYPGEPVHVSDDDHILGRIRELKKEVREQQGLDMSENHHHHHHHHHQQSITVPSDADVGYEYWKSAQPQPHPGEPIHLIDEADAARGQVLKAEKYSRGKAHHPHRPRPSDTDSMGRYFGEVAGEDGFYAAGKRICDYLINAYIPIHGGDPIMEALPNAHNVPAYKNETEARSKARFSCANKGLIWIRRYCNAPKVTCTKDGAFHPWFQDRYSATGAKGQAALPLDFCLDFPRFVDSIDSGRDLGARPTFCIRRTEADETVALECRSWHKNFATNCVGRDLTQTSGWFNFSARSYDHLPW
ncbi:hypothetical protein CP533_2493 [Ophiocordyceps camponoti-saundersi (nom. inval.)]|nr:hypothetical protein CP533_2493 [Ophiocordyceps camponoti-saundersi (nom. inval.)]